MLVSVSTVKDTLPNVERFVRRNLAHGIDHLVVCLDEPEPAVEAFLEGEPHATLVRAYGPWWRRARPESLNARQGRNADVVNALLTGFGWAEWLFHIDGDEVVLLDRDRLEALPQEVGVVVLRPLEAVATRNGTGTTFKRLLDEEELARLRASGVLGGSRNREYFHGHVAGKSGIRPTLDLLVSVHRPRDRERRPVTGLSEDWLTLLHLESTTPAEFARKWRNFAVAGKVGRRGERARVMDAVRELIDAGLEDRVVERGLERLWEQEVEDDVPALSALGLLVEADPDEVRYAPRPVPPEDLRTLERGLGRVAGKNRAPFSGGDPSAAAALRDRVLRP